MGLAKVLSYMGRINEEKVGYVFARKILPIGM
jgi:hypothetical protein